MSIGIAGFGHETITFQPGTTDLPEFERITVHDQAVLDGRRGTNTVAGGYIETCEILGKPIVPVCDVEPGPGATVTDRAFEFYTERICKSFTDARKDLEGILLALHGAMVTESYQCPELVLLKRLRDAVGPELPIVAAFDLHGNIDLSILELVDAVVGYHSSPHVDMASTGKRAAHILFQKLAGEVKPACAAKKPGVVVPSVFSATTIPPAKEIMDRVHMWRNEPGVLDVSFLFGFAWSDVHQIGCTAVAVTDNDPPLSERIVTDLSELAWERRRSLNGKGHSGLLPLKEGVSRAIVSSEKHSRPVLLLDHADRTNDTTFVLEELINREVKNVAVPLFRDPDAVKACVEAGKGAKVSLTVGAKTGWNDNRPISFEGVVEWVGNGTYTGTGPMSAGLPVDLGLTAIVQSSGISLQLISHNAVLIDQDPFLRFGRRPEDFGIILSKSKTHFRAVYQELSAEIIIVDAPGQCPANLGMFDYRNVPEGVYPITWK